jgi:hypothetical protein
MRQTLGAETPDVPGTFKLEVNSSVVIFTWGRKSARKGDLSFFFKNFSLPGVRLFGLLMDKI